MMTKGKSRKYDDRITIRLGEMKDPHWALQKEGRQAGVFRFDTDPAKRALRAYIALWQAVGIDGVEKLEAIAKLSRMGLFEFVIAKVEEAIKGKTAY